MRGKIFARALRNVTFIPPLSLRLRCHCPIRSVVCLKPKRAVAPDGSLFSWADTERTRRKQATTGAFPVMRSTKSRAAAPNGVLDNSFRENPPRNSMRYVTRPAFLCVEYNYTQRTLELAVDNPLDNGLLVCFILGHFWPNVTVPIVQHLVNHVSCIGHDALCIKSLPQIREVRCNMDRI